MSTIRFNDGTEFSATEIHGGKRDFGDRYRESVACRVTGSYADVAAKFINDASFSVVEIEQGEEVLYPKPEYCVAGKLIDNRDGTITAIMGTRTDDETALFAAQTENASYLQLIQDTRANLTPVPVSGETWDATHRYITGDTVVYEGINYTAFKFSHGDRPDESPDHWEPAPVEEVFTAWADIEDGTVIYEGDVVTCDGANWVCSSQHIKSAVYKPKAGSSKWESHV